MLPLLQVSASQHLRHRQAALLHQRQSRLRQPTEVVEVALMQTSLTAHCLAARSHQITELFLLNGLDLEAGLECSAQVQVPLHLA